MKFSISSILALVALLLAIFALLDVVRSGAALSLAVICLAVAMLLPAVGILGSRNDRL